jgi:hypothetical protein
MLGESRAEIDIEAGGRDREHEHELVDRHIVRQFDIGGEDEWKHLHGRLKELSKRRVVLEAIEADLLVEAEDTGLYRRLGYPTMHVYMEQELHYGRLAANERLRVARALSELPNIAAAFRAGELPFSVVREVTRPATEDNEDAWLAEIRGKTAAQVQQLVKGRREGDLPEDPPDPSLIKERIMVEVSAETYALWRQARIAIDEERGEHVSDDELVQTMCRRALDPVVATPDRPMKPAFQIAVTTCRQCKRGMQVGPGVEIELSPAVLARAQCDADEVGDLEDDTPARVKPTIPYPTRRKVFVRDRFACTYPGCTSRRHLEAHHLERRADGGDHQMSNISVLCSFHHQGLHEGRITIRGRAPDLVFTTTEDDPGPSWD